MFSRDASNLQDYSVNIYWFALIIQIGRWNGEKFSSFFHTILRVVGEPESKNRKHTGFVGLSTVTKRMNEIMYLDSSTSSGEYPHLGDPIPSYGEVLVELFPHRDLVAGLEFRTTETVFPRLEGEFTPLYSFIP